MPLSPSYYKPDHQAFVTRDPGHLNSNARVLKYFTFVVESKYRHSLVN